MTNINHLITSKELFTFKKAKLINRYEPSTIQIIEVLNQIAKNEEIDLSVNFAAKIATKSKQNLRKAIMALEACNAHK